MRGQKYITSTVLAALLLTTAGYQPSHAQEQSLQPKGAWSITKIDRSAKGGNSYCTLSRAYDNGAVLSLGRNQTEEYSLAIDFQQPIFERDKALKINLQPGPGQVRAYDMMPTSEKAIVVRLGWDSGFFTALNASQQMKIKIGDKGYDFAVPEIAKGEKELTSCMNQLKGSEERAPTKDVLNAKAGSADQNFEAQKASTAVAMNTKATPVPTDRSTGGKSAKDILIGSVSDIEPAAGTKDQAFVPRPPMDDTDSLSKETAARKREKTSDVAQQEPEKNAAKELNAESLASLTRESSQQIKDLQDQLAKTKEENRKNKQAADVAKAAIEASNEKASEDMDVLQKKINELTQKNEVLSKTATTGTDAQKKLTDVETQKKQLQEKVAALETAQKKTAESTVKKTEAETLQKNNEQLKDQIEDLKTAKAAADNKALAETQAKLSDIEKRNKELEENLKQSQIRISETAINTQNKSTRKIEDLEGKLSAAQTDNAKLAKQIEELRIQQEDVRMSKASGNADLESTTRRFNEAEREIKRLGQVIEKEKAECVAQKADIENMLFDPAVTDKKQMERLAELEAELDKARDAIRDQQKLVQYAVDQQVAEKQKAMQAEKEALQQQIASLKAVGVKAASGNVPASTIDALNKQAEEYQSLVATYKSDNDKLTASNDDLKKEATKLQKQVAELQQKGPQDEAVLKDNEKLKKELATATKEKEGLAEKIEEMGREFADLKKAGDNARSEEIVSLQKRVDDLIRENQTAKAEVANTRQALAELEAEQTQNTSADQARLKMRNTALKTENASLSAQNRDLQAKIAAIASDSTKTAGLNQDATARIQQLAENNTVLESEAKSLRKQVNVLQAAGMQAAGKISQADAIAARQTETREKLASLTKEADSLRAENATLKQDADQARIAMAAAENQKDSATEQAETAKALAAKNDALQISLQASLDASEKLRQQVIALQGDNIENLERLTAAQGLTAKNSALQGELTKAGTETQGLRAQNDALKSESDSLKARLAKLEEGLASREADSTDTLKKIDELTQKLTAKTTQESTYQQRISALEKEIKANETRLSLASANAKQIDAMSTQIQALQKKLSATQSSGESERFRDIASAEAVASTLNTIQPSVGRAAVAATPAPPSSPVPDAGAILKTAGIDLKNLGAKVSGNRVNWRSGAVEGAAILSAANGSLDTMAQKYIASEKAKCSGDFASMPSAATSGKMALYETACVSGVQNTSSSMLFFEKDGQFVAVANKTGADNMDAAMDVRDRLAKDVASAL